MEVDGAVAVATPGAVLHIALDGAADCGQLGPDLVMPAGDEADMQQMVALAAAQQAVVQLGALGAGALFQVGVRAILRSIFLQVMHQYTFRFGRCVRHHGEVFLFNGMLLELLLHLRHGGLRAGQQQYAAGRAVQAMYRMEGLLELGLGPLQQGNVAGFVGLGGHSARFVYGDQDRILEEYSWHLLKIKRPNFRHRRNLFVLLTKKIQKHFNMRVRLSLFLCFYTIVLFAQPDTTSLLLKPERLDERNIELRNQGTPKRKAISATRSLEEVDQLPFTVWVVTAEDILRNGFVTLGDVLRAAPGVRVSQPGNALEGETFMMRGLSGNQYVKVLINDVPVKPAAAPGMPIGAQIPVRQAERIEVLYGPAAAIYGDGACAGVVNIVLKETERPIFTQADLAFGNFGYNSLDLMLGGKLFQDKNIFRFSLYGSSTVRESLDYFYDDKLFTPKTYLPFGLDSTLYAGRLNYRPQDTGDSVARSAPIPHESRLLGIDLTWRGIHFNYNRLTRFDHSSLGLSPLANSYANPSNRIAEQIETFAFSFKRQRAKRTATNTLSVIRYRVRDNSSFTPVFDQLSTALYYAKAPQIQSDAERQMVLDNIYARYASNERYFTANGIDARFESLISAALRPNLYLNAGIQANLGGGVPAMGYFRAPVEAKIFGESVPADPEPIAISSDGDLDLNTFAQLQWRSKRMTVIGGAALNVPLDHPVAFAPRMALQYRLDSIWVLRSSYSEGFRRPSVYARVHSYRIDAQDTLSVQPSEHPLNQTERVRAAEFGLRKYNGQFTTDLLFFYQEAHRLVRNGYLLEDTPYWTSGFQNAPGLAMSIWGIQGTLGDDIMNFDVSKHTPEKGSVTGHAEFYFQYARGREWFGYGLPATRDVRNFPRWMTQFRFSLRAEKWEFMVNTNRQNAILSSAAVYRDFYQRQFIQLHYPAYRTWDTMLRIYLSQNFLIYAHVRNLFNRHYAGIDATGTADDLLYNPQPGRMLRFGVNYNMN